MGTGNLRNAPCRCGSGNKAKRCCGPEAPTESIAPAAEIRSGRAPTLIIAETDDGFVLQRPPVASTLPSDQPVGPTAEAAVRRVAEELGLRDFVLEPKERSTGSGRQELGDGLLMLGDTKVVLQVKARDGRWRGDDAERRWLDKVILKAVKQGNGTVRALGMKPAEFINGRGRAVTVDGSGDWLTVVVIDHNGIPEGYVPSLDEARHASVVLTRADWEFLHRQLGSARGVVDYLGSIANDPRPLATEVTRYYEIAMVGGAPDSRRPHPHISGGALVTTARLPLLTTPEDTSLGQIVRTILEDIAASSSAIEQEDGRLHALAALDRVPPTQRADLGRFLMRHLQRCADGSDSAIAFRRLLFDDETVQLGFAVGACPPDEGPPTIRSWVDLRHVQVSTPERPELLTVGVLLTPRHDGKRDWDTHMAAVRGQIELDPELRTAYEDAWPLES